MSPEANESSLQFDLLAWFELNRQRILIGFGVILALIAAVIVWRWQVHAREAEASQALFAAPGVPGASLGEARMSGDTLAKLAEEHNGTHAGERALLLAAGQLYTEGKYAEAQARFAAFPQQYGDSPFISVAALGVATTLDAQDKTTEALAAYQDVIARFGTEPVANQAKLAKARLHESLNQPEQALALYDDLAKSGMFTPLAQQATTRREQLLTKHPALARPPQQILTNSVIVNPAPAPVPAPAVTPSAPKP